MENDTKGNFAFQQPPYYCPPDNESDFDERCRRWQNHTLFMWRRGIYTGLMIGIGIGFLLGCAIAVWTRTP
jgi:hypothetical protein